jgi:hypothetical protein
MKLISKWVMFQIGCYLLTNLLSMKIHNKQSRKIEQILYLFLLSLNYKNDVQNCRKKPPK